MEFADLPEEIHHHIFQFLGDKDFENLQTLNNPQINESIQNLWIKARVSGIDWSANKFALTLHTMTKNPQRKRFYLGSQSDSNTDVDYVPTSRIEKKALKIVMQHNYALESGLNMDPYLTPLAVAIQFAPGNDNPRDPITLTRTKGDPNEMLLTRTHEHYMLIQTPNKLYFLDLKARELLWHRGYTYHDYDDQTLDFVINDHGIFLTMKKNGYHGKFLIMAEFGFSNGNISGVQTTQSLNFIFDSTNSGITLNTRKGSVSQRFYDCFQLEDVLSIWLDHDRLFVLVKEDKVYRVLSESLSEEKQQKMRCDLIVVTDFL